MTSYAIEDQWLEARPAERLKIIATLTVQARIAEGHAYAEFNELLTYYSSGNWVSDNVPAEALNTAINTARDTLETLQYSRQHLMARLDESLRRTHLPGVSIEAHREVLLRDAVMACGTDHISQYAAVADLIDEYAPDQVRKRTSSRPCSPPRFVLKIGARSVGTDVVEPAVTAYLVLQGKRTIWRPDGPSCPPEQIWTALRPASRSISIG